MPSLTHKQIAPARFAQKCAPANTAPNLARISLPPKSRESHPSSFSSRLSSRTPRLSSRATFQASPTNKSLHRDLHKMRAAANTAPNLAKISLPPKSRESHPSSLTAADQQPTTNNQLAMAARRSRAATRKAVETMVRHLTKPESAIDEWLALLLCPVGVREEVRGCARPLTIRGTAVVIANRCNIAR